MLVLLVGMVAAQEKPVPQNTLFEDAERKAKQLYAEAMQMMDYKQYERGLDMLNKVVRDNQGTILSYRAHMAMGKHFADQGKPTDALRHFILLTRVLAPKPGEELPEEELDLFCESLYRAALAQSRTNGYSAAFPLLRRLLKSSGKKKWTDLAYFHIGEGHYHLENWNKMIDVLSMVGTTADDSEGELGRIEIGQRFYAMITDADIPVLRRIKRPVRARVTTSSGDAEVLEGDLVGSKDDAVIVSCTTELGRSKPGDGKLQLLGGDTVTVTYLDESTQDGRKDVPRRGKVRAVSSGTVGFFLGDFETPAYIAYPGQLQPLVLRDADLDASPKAERIKVTVSSQYKESLDWEGTNSSSSARQDIFAEDEEEEDKWRERDRVTVVLTEQGSGPAIHSGSFIGKVPLEPLVKGQSPDKADNVLHCKEMDELSVVYVDDVHLHGDEPRRNESRIKVSGSVSSGVKAEQYIVFETLLKSRKACVEAKAFVELGEIYKDMGLRSHVVKYANEVLQRVNPVILERTKLPGDLVESAFRLKWESELLKDEFATAADTCLAFNRMYPESILADQALMTVGRSLTAAERYDQAVGIYRKVLELQNPISAAEAQYRIGETLVKQAEAFSEAGYGGGEKVGITEAERNAALLEGQAKAISAFQDCYQKYPESTYAAESLQQVIMHHMDSENYGQVATLLETVFADYPDATFLDEMLMAWAEVAYKLGDPERSKEKLRQLIFDYPQSNLISDARSKLAALEARD